jgi:hypothetical protein
MSQPASSPELGDEVAAQRRARLHARMAELGKRPLTGAEILALQSADDDGFPDSEELDAEYARLRSATESLGRPVAPTISGSRRPRPPTASRSSPSTGGISSRSRCMD